MGNANWSAARAARPRHRRDRGREWYGERYCGCDARSTCHSSKLALRIALDVKRAPLDTNAAPFPDFYVKVAAEIVSTGLPCTVDGSVARRIAGRPSATQGQRRRAHPRRAKRV